jgi:hypothetical protein
MMLNLIDLQEKILKRCVYPNQLILCKRFENFHLIRKMQGKQNDHLDLIVISILPPKYHTKSKSPHV